MAQNDFELAKNTFSSTLLKLALKNINCIPASVLTELSNYVAEEYITPFTLYEFSSNLHIQVSTMELLK